MRSAACILTIFVIGCADNSSPVEQKAIRASETNMRLKIELPATWAQAHNPDGPATFFRENGSGAFQVSWAEYVGGQRPNVTTDGLKQMAEQFGRKNGFGELKETRDGKCRFGTFGTSVFSSAEYPHIQVCISDGRDHIMATHICSEVPEPNEIAEARQIASSLALGPEHPQKADKENERSA
jgi:hypothetical protein